MKKEDGKSSSTAMILVCDSERGCFDLPHDGIHVYLSRLVWDSEERASESSARQSALLEESSSIHNFFYQRRRRSIRTLNSGILTHVMPGCIHVAGQRALGREKHPSHGKCCAPLCAPDCTPPRYRAPLSADSTGSINAAFCRQYGAAFLHAVS